MNLIEIIKAIFWNYIASPLSQARHKGAHIGNNCFIATRNFPTESYLIEIGDNCQLTKDVYLHTHGGAHVARHLLPEFDVFGKIKIGNGVYIGAGSHILPGVSIGDHSLIAAGSVVSKSVPANELWGGQSSKANLKLG